MSSVEQSNESAVQPNEWPATYVPILGCFEPVWKTGGEIVQRYLVQQLGKYEDGYEGGSDGLQW